MNNFSSQAVQITFCEEYISPAYYDKKDVVMVHLIATTDSGLSFDIDVSKTFNQDSKITQILCAINNVGWRQVYSRYGKENLDCLLNKPFLADVHTTEPNIITGKFTYYIDNIRPMLEEIKKEVSADE
ncbi:hypothetical protein V6615_03940 [Oscillospiraceae bacterium PP1C4]